MSAQSQVGLRALEVVVCLQDSIVDVIHVRGEGVVTAGSTEGCHIPLPAGALGVGVESIVVARATTGARPQVVTALTGDAPMRELAALENVPLAIGPLRIHVRDVADVAPVALKSFRADKKVIGVVAASFAAHMAFLIVLTMIPPSAHGLSLDMEYRMDRGNRAQVKPHEDPLVQPDQDDGQTEGVDGEQTGAMAHEGAEGKIGNPNKTAQARLAVKGNRPMTKFGAGDPRAARRAGVMRYLDSTSFSEVTGEGDEWGDATANSYGGDTEGDGEGNGTWGAAYAHNGRGGCPAGQVCGPSTVGKRGYVTGNNPDGGYEPGTTHTIKRDPKVLRVPVTKIGTVVGEDGGLDREIVRRVIISHRAEIEYCYERQLIANPELGGDVVVEFTIGTDGRVESARIASSSVGGKEVASCVERQARTWKFPPSSSRTHVKKSFSFRVAGK